MPQYFFKFPKLLKNNIILTDLTTRVNLREKFFDNDDLFYSYDYQDGDTPEILASKYYGSPELHWIILVTNNIFDHNFDCPMPLEVFTKYLNDKYKNTRSVSSLFVREGGINYVDGVYKDIPLQIKNPEELSSIGYGLRATIRVNSGRLVSPINLKTGGTDYDANTVFTVDNQYTGGYGSGAELLITGYRSGYEYAQSTVHPEYGYKKEIRIFDVLANDYEIASGNNKLIVTSEPNSILSQTYYQIDEDSYYSLYEGTDPHPAEYLNTQEDGLIGYDSIRVPPITIFQYEQRLNENKRKIKILKKEYYGRVLNEFLSLISKTYA